MRLLCSRRVPREGLNESPFVDKSRTTRSLLYTLVPFWFSRLMQPNLSHAFRQVSLCSCLVAIVVFLVPPGLCGQDELSPYARRALMQLVAGDYPEAEEFCDRVIDWGSADAHLAMIRIRAQMAQGKYEEAAESALKASRQFAGYFPIQVTAIELAAGRIQYTLTVDITPTCGANWAVKGRAGNS